MLEMPPRLNRVPTISLENSPLKSRWPWNSGLVPMLNWGWAKKAATMPAMVPASRARKEGTFLTASTIVRTGISSRNRETR